MYNGFYYFMGVFLIAFRDFTESFLIISLLLGFSRKNDLGEEKSILTGGIVGLIVSLTMTILIYFILPLLRFVLSTELIDQIGHVSTISSGLLMLYITYKIHPFFSKNRDNRIQTLLENIKVSKVPFFIIAFLLVFQEGLEIIIFTTTISFLQSFFLNALSLILGFLTALTVGILVYKTYLINHIKKLFRITEIILIIYSIYLILHGLIEMSESFIK